jgi:tRNA(fMet)-specific endonuclease VapC
MSYLLDTNIMSAHFRRPAGLAHRFFQYSGRLYTSSICLSELYVWAYARADPAPILASIEQLLHYEVSIIDFGSKCAEHFGKTRANLRKTGIEVSTVDLMIASVALHHDLTLVTNNTNDFRKIPDLILEDWPVR